MQETSLKKRYVIKLLANITSGIIGAILVVLVPKALGAVAYGQFIYIQSFFTQCIGFLDAGSSIAFFTKLSARNSRKELINFYFLFSFLLLAILFVFVLFVDFFEYTQFFLPDIPKEYIYIGLYFGFFSWFTQIFIKIADAYALTVSVELIKIAHKILSLFLLFYFVYGLVFDLTIYFYFHYISLFSFIGIVSILFIKKDIFDNTLFRVQFDFESIAKEFVEFCSPLVIYSLVSVVIGLFDIWLLQKVSGSLQTGFYGLAYSLVAMSFLFTSAMTPIITREFSKAYELKDLEQMRSLFFRYIPMLYSIAAYFGIFIAFQSENVLFIFTDEQFKDVFWVLVIMAFYPLHQTYGQLSGSIFYATGQTKLYKNIGIFTAIVGAFLTVGCVYILELGAIGLALKMIIVQLLGANMQLYFNSKFLDFKMLRFLLHQIYSIIFFSLLAFLSSIVVSIFSPIINFLISGILYTLLVIIFTYLFPVVFATTKDEIRVNWKKFLKSI